MTQRIRVETVVDISPVDIVDGSFSGSKPTAKRIASFIVGIDQYAVDWKLTEICWRYFEKIRRLALRTNEGGDWLGPRPGRRALEVTENKLQRAKEQLDLARLRSDRQAEDLKIVHLANEELQKRLSAFCGGESDTLRRLRTAVRELETMKGDPRHAEVATAALEKIGLRLAASKRA